MSDNKRVIVTGGSGFLGSYAVARLWAEGFEPYVFDRALHAGLDITDKGAVAAYFLAADPYAVIHLSGVLGTHELYDNVGEAVAVNVGGMANVLSAVREANERAPVRLVVVDQPHIWTNPYETTKEAAVRLARGFSQEFGFPLTTVVPYNAFGPGQAHGPGHPQKIIPTFATKAWLGEPLPIWGDGSQVVDLVWAGDVADALVRGIHNGKVGGYESHAGTGEGFTVNEVAEYVWGWVRFVRRSRGEHVPLTFYGPPIDYLPMRRGETSVDPRLSISPFANYPFRLDRLRETVESYEPGAKTWVATRVTGNV
jgi:UDP-glucose 4-epimerase